MNIIFNIGRPKYIVTKKEKKKLTLDKGKRGGN